MRLLRLILLMVLLAACSSNSQSTVVPPRTEANATGVPSTARPTATLLALAPTAVPSEQPTTQPTVVPVEPTAVAANNRLPAALYYLSAQAGTNQIYRMEADGITKSQITNEAEGVTGYAVSPVDSALVYVSTNDLLRTDAAGANRTVLVNGADLDPDDINDQYANQITNPIWSPDGSQIAFGLGGVNVMPASGGTPTMLQPHQPQTNAEMADLFDFNALHAPFSWSPDGSRMLTSFDYVPEGGSYTVLDLATTSPITLTNNEGFLCCNPIWSGSGAVIYFANDFLGMVQAGMWEANAQTGAVTQLFGTPDGGAPWTLIRGPLPVGNDAFLAFYSETEDESVANGQAGQALTMTQINADGSTAPLRSTANTVGEVLWALDSSGAVISESPFDEAPLQWLPSDDSSAVALDATGRELRWAHGQ